MPSSPGRYNLSALGLFSALALLTGSGRAQLAAPEPVGFLPIVCPGSSDTIVAIPFTRPTVYIGSGAMTAGGSTATLTFSGTTASFTAGQFIYSSPAQTNTYYLLITSGTKTGSYYTITANTTNGVTIDLNGDTFPSASVGAKIVPYWTLGTLFASGSGIPASTSGSIAAEVLLLDATGTGANLGFRAAYNYSTTSGYFVATGTAGSQNNVILYPDLFFVLRNYTATSSTLTVAGSVITGTFSLPLATETSGPQDNPVALPRALAYSASASNLASVLGTASGFQPGDQVFLYDNSSIALNKSASAIYTYTAGAWRKSGGTGNAGADTLITPGSGLLIRKRPTASGTSVIWSNPPNFTY